MQALWKLPGAQRRQVRLALTRTYRAPQLSQLVARRYYTAINTQVSPDFAGNPRLQPELASGIDAAYEYYFSEGALLSVSAASREISNFIRSRLRLDGERWVWFPDNQGRAHVHSVEFEMKFPLRAFVKTAPALDLRASASRNWSRVDQVPGPDNRLDRQPAWSANLGADFRHGALSGGASLVLSAGGWTRTAVYQETYASVRRDLEAYALYKLTASSQVRFTALNLLRPDTLWALHYHDDSTVQDSASVRSTWRGWRVQYEYKF
jgi:outer membrane receptor protein involved in Fe transport